MWRSYARNYGIQVRIARFHNIFGPDGTCDGGKEKAPAAMCRKVAMAEWDPEEGLSIDVWGPGNQTRSFLYIDECIEATRRFMDGDFEGPVNIGSEEMIAINEFVRMAVDISGKDVSLYNIEGDEFEQKYGHPCPIGVNGRNSDNTLYREKIGWAVSQPLRTGMEKTYQWICKQIEKRE